MTASQKIILVGIGFIIGTIVIGIGGLYHIIPDYKDRPKMVWGTIGVGCIMGTAFILTGLLMK